VSEKKNHADPMTPERRSAAYSQTKGRSWTPRQFRRWRKKHNRALGKAAEQT
jgi:hypothetical protein